MINTFLKKDKTINRFLIDMKQHEEEMPVYSHFAKEVLNKIEFA